VLSKAIAAKRTDSSFVLYNAAGEPPPLTGVHLLGSAGDGLQYATLKHGKHAGSLWIVGEAWTPVLDVKPLQAALAAPTRTRTLVLADFHERSIPDVFGGLPKLEELSISHCPAAALPGSMRSLAKLRKLSLTSMTALVDIEPITGLPALQVLHLGRSKQVALTDAIAGLASLEQLFLSFTAITTLPTGLAKLARLRALHLDLCFSLDLQRAWPVLAQLPALRTLNLAKSRLLRWPAKLDRPRSLELLDLRGAELPAGQLDRLRAALPGVTVQA